MLTKKKLALALHKTLRAEFYKVLLSPAGMAAIHEAVLSGNLACVKLLVEHGADIQQQDEEGWSPLHMACSDGFPDIAR